MVVLPRSVSVPPHKEVDQAPLHHAHPRLVTHARGSRGCRCMYTDDSSSSASFYPCSHASLEAGGRQANVEVKVDALFCCGDGVQDCKLWRGPATAGLVSFAEEHEALSSCPCRGTTRCHVGMHDSSQTSRAWRAGPCPWLAGSGLRPLFTHIANFYMKSLTYFNAI